MAPACLYQKPISSLIHRYKYGKIEEIKKILSAILIVYLKRVGINLNNFIIVPIPLYPARERKRGFNQSDKIAEIISKEFKLQKEDILRRIENNKPQAKMKSHKDREQNMKDSFVVKNNEKIKNKNIILIDDVSTSGITLDEASKILKENGAKKIIGLVVAKAI